MRPAKPLPRANIEFQYSTPQPRSVWREPISLADAIKKRDELQARVEILNRRSIAKTAESEAVISELSSQVRMCKNWIADHRDDDKKNHYLLVAMRSTLDALDRCEEEGFKLSDEEITQRDRIAYYLSKFEEEKDE